MMPILPQIWDGARFNWCEFMASNMRQQIDEIQTHRFQHPSLSLATLFHQCSQAQPLQIPIHQGDPMIKQRINIFPNNVQDLEIKRQVKKEIAKIIKWIQHKLGSQIPLQYKQVVKKSFKHGSAEVEKEESTPSSKEWEMEPPFQIVTEPRQRSSQQQNPLEGKGKQIV